MTPDNLAISTQQLRLGMFVADLDRSWDGTPFPLQGILVTDPRQINYLRQLCREVVIDVRRSSDDSIQHLPPRIQEGPYVQGDKRSARTRFGRWLRTWLEMAVAAWFGAHGGASKGQVRLDGMPAHGNRITYRDTRSFNRSRHRPRVGLGRWIRDWWERAVAALFGRRGAGPLRTRLAGMPADVDLVTYHDTKSFDEALGPARQAYREIEATMKTVMIDLAEKREMSFDVLSTAAAELVESIAVNPEAMMWLTRMREQNLRTYRHSVEVAIYMITFGRHLGFPVAHLRKFCLIGLLLDVGMTRIDTALLEKTGPLSESELAEIHRHVDYSLEMLADSPDLDPEVREAIAEHHERVDGSGYPRRLRGEDTSFAGRMVAIADTFAALTSRQPQAEPLSAFKAMKALSDGAGTYFHEALVEQFVQAIGFFPVGSLVELSSGEVAAVVSHNKVRRLKPRVLILTDVDKKPLDTPREENLLLDPLDHNDEPLRIWRGLPAHAYGVNPRDFFLK